MVTYSTNEVKSIADAITITEANDHFEGIEAEY